MMDNRQGGRWPGEKLVARIVSIGSVLAVLAPIIQNWRKQPSDGFPLSYYPMFSVKRGKQIRVSYLLGITVAGERRPLPYRYAGSGGLNQVRRQINRHVREGSADRLAKDVARQIASRDTRKDADIVAVEIVTGTFAFADYYAGHREPRKVKTLASRPVPNRTVAYPVPQSKPNEPAVAGPHTDTPLADHAAASQAQSYPESVFRDALMRDTPASRANLLIAGLKADRLMPAAERFSADPNGPVPESLGLDDVMALLQSGSQMVAHIQMLGVV